MIKTVALLLISVLPMLALGDCVDHSTASAQNPNQAVKSGGQDSGDDWLRANYQRVIDAIFPLDVRTEPFPQDVQWMVRVRIFPSSENGMDHEYFFSLVKKYNGLVIADVVMPQRLSIGTQLRYLRQEHPDKSIEELTQMLCLAKWTASAREPQGLGKTAADFGKIRISPVMPDTLIIHPTGYQVWSQSLWGNRMQFSLDGPGPGARRQPHSLLQWVEDVRKTIEKERGRAAQ